jgi:hypothetical protein
MQIVSSPAPLVVTTRWLGKCAMANATEEEESCTVRTPLVLRRFLSTPTPMQKPPGSLLDQATGGKQR